MLVGFTQSTTNFTSADTVKFRSPDLPRNNGVSGSSSNKHKQIANSDSVNNLMSQWNTSYQHAQYWQKNNTKIGMIERVLNYTVTYARKRVKLDKHWYDRVPQSLETRHKGNLPRQNYS